MLLGLARVVGDGETIASLQDVLIHPSARHRPRRVVLVFEPLGDVRPHPLRAFVRFRG
ncbi:hypothetical protein [Leifsonia aquatica]|uniref:hypothetical protein n=1 Tax=Leifsonia aquatica TaxID=144185 RepID=UPI000A758B5C|nr:hypothetical protein [Leifsonia aquatica]